MKTHQQTLRPTTAYRHRRQITPAFPHQTIAPIAPAPAARQAAGRRPLPAHDFLALCLYPGMGENHTAA